MNLDASNWPTQIVLQEKVPLTLREECPNSEFFLVRIQENTD